MPGPWDTTKTYKERILDIYPNNLCRYFTMQETSGAPVDSAHSAVSNVQVDLQYNQASFIPGLPCIGGNGTSSGAKLGDATSLTALQALMNHDEVTVNQWIKKASTWNTNDTRQILKLGADGGSGQVRFQWIQNGSNPNTLQYAILRNGASYTYNYTITSLDWIMLTMVGSVAADRVRFYANGQPVNTIAGFPSASVTIAQASTRYNMWYDEGSGGRWWFDGLIAHHAVWSVAMDDTDVANLYNYQQTSGSDQLIGADGFPIRSNAPIMAQYAPVQSGYRIG